MEPEKIIEGKRLLLVDDEQDVLDSLCELLEMCKLDTALSYERGKELLEKYEYDVAVLDIMGVKGFDLLKISIEQDTPALMLTAHGLSEQNLEKSAKEGAAYFAPKDEMINIQKFVADIITAQEKNKNVWAKWFERLGGYYDRRFKGTEWRKKSDEFWKNKLKEYGLD